MNNRKLLGRCGVQGYWMKRFGEYNAQIAAQLNTLLIADQVTTDYTTVTKIVLLLTKIEKDNAVANYRPISSFPFMWKIINKNSRRFSVRTLEKRNLAK